MKKSFVWIGLLLVISPAQAQQAKQQESNDPYSSCRLLVDEQRQCSGFDSCDQRVMEQLKKECLLDGETISWPPIAGSSW
jgi:hypothetical protein